MKGSCSRAYRPQWHWSRSKETGWPTDATSTRRCLLHVRSLHVVADLRPALGDGCRAHARPGPVALAAGAGTVVPERVDPAAVGLAAPVARPVVEHLLRHRPCDRPGSLPRAAVRPPPGSLPAYAHDARAHDVLLPRRRAGAGRPSPAPELGFVDTAHTYGQSVYAATLGPDSFNQLSAMPSVHVGWAVLIGWFAWRVGTGRWRWIAVAHAVLTIVVVTITANHWILGRGHTPWCCWESPIGTRCHPPPARWPLNR